MRRKRIRRGVATRREAVRGDHATLQALELEAARREGRPSLYRRARRGRPAGVLPTAAHGIALRNFVPADHMAIAHGPVRKGRRDGLFYYEAPALELDDDGSTVDRPDLPATVDVDGVEVVVERDGVEMTEDDFEPEGVAP